MRELVLALMTWIAGETGLSVPPPPSVELVPQEQLSQIAYGQAGTRDDGVQALYHQAKAVVYLHEGWSENDPHCLGTLLHELVHHVQAYNRVHYKCPAAKERQAYDLSLKWLRERDVPDPYAVLKIDKFTITALSVCVESE